jgi:hypothetical protein
MTTLTSSATLTLTSGTPVSESISVTVLPAVPYGEGKGRLVHPTLGAYDYDLEPTEWTNVFGDTVIQPVWSSTRTLDGASNSLWAGSIRDVVCEERWTAQGGLAMTSAQFAIMLAMYQQPPDPETAWVLWYPNYATDVGYKVLLTELSAGDSNAVVLNGFARAGFIAGKVTLKMRIVGKV